MLHSFKLKTSVQAGLATRAVFFPFQTCCEIKRFHWLLPVDISVTKVDYFYVLNTCCPLPTQAFEIIYKPKYINAETASSP